MDLSGSDAGEEAAGGGRADRQPRGRRPEAPGRLPRPAGPVCAAGHFPTGPPPSTPPSALRARASALTLPRDRGVDRTESTGRGGGWRCSGRRGSSAGRWPGTACNRASMWSACPADRTPTGRPRSTASRPPPPCSAATHRAAAAAAAAARPQVSHCRRAAPRPIAPRLPPRTCRPPTAHLPAVISRQASPQCGGHPPGQSNGPLRALHSPAPRH